MYNNFIRGWRVRAAAGLSVVAVTLGVLTPASQAATYTPNSMYLVAQQIGAPAMWNAGFTGKGVDIAIIDTGVTPVTGLSGNLADGRPKVFHGPDLSFDSQNSKLRYLDGYGHGTHMAGIMAGKDAGWTPGNAASYWAGIAPDSRILSVKAGDQGGTVDATQLVAAIYWVVQHRKDNGLNIRVLNLSFGSTGSAGTSDMLYHAVEVARNAGILVIVSAGNSGVSAKMANPAQTVYAASTGSVDTKGTVTRSDDTGATFSQYNPEVTGAAPNFNLPGTSISGLAVPGSYLDLAYPGARDGTRFFRGSGTSQSAAVASGAAALLLQQRPTATPAQIQMLLQRSCPTCASLAMYEYPPAHSLIDLARAKDMTTPGSVDGSRWSSGSGDIDFSRGTARVSYNGVTLTGEKDIFGHAWSSRRLAKAAAGGTAWTGGTFNGNTWAGTTWNGNTFASATWSGTNFAGAAWSGMTSTDMVWDGTKWQGTKWQGTKWQGTKWQGTTWKADVWAGAGWE